jgi:hypothetical protein
MIAVGVAKITAARWTPGARWGHILPIPEQERHASWARSRHRTSTAPGLNRPPPHLLNTLPKNPKNPKNPLDDPGPAFFGIFGFFGRPSALTDAAWRLPN